MSIDIRSITESEWPEFAGAITRAFGGDLPPDQPIRLKEILPIDRTIAAFDGDDLVGTFGSFPLEMTVPGGIVVTTAGTTIVSVTPTHRRRGLLSQMMRRHLDQTRADGEPIAALWASEAAIYGRFGYGSAVDMIEMEVDGRGSAVAFPAGSPDISLRIWPPDELGDVLPRIYDTVRLARPGMLARSEAWWAHRRLPDPEDRREGASARRTVVASRDGDPVGYAMYRQKGKWGDAGPEGRIEANEVIAVDEDTRRSLWAFLGNIDLCPVVSHWNMAVDDPLWWDVGNPRAFTRKVSDGIWVRLVDVAEALRLRRYENDGTVNIAVVDDVCPWNAGTVRLEVVGGLATVSPTTQPADITCPVASLGAIYLGGRSVTTLAAAGRVDADAATIGKVDRLFRSSVAPWCEEIF